jgi:uncharacterized protein with WD repeat
LILHFSPHCGSLSLFNRSSTQLNGKETGKMTSLTNKYCCRDCASERVTAISAAEEYSGD